MNIKSEQKEDSCKKYLMLVKMTYSCPQEKIHLQLLKYLLDLYQTILPLLVFLFKCSGNTKLIYLQSKRVNVYSRVAINSNRHHLKQTTICAAFLLNFMFFLPYTHEKIFLNAKVKVFNSESLRITDIQRICINTFTWNFIFPKIHQIYPI